MIVRCTDEPISWLRLERYHLGELDEAERAQIASHLARCAACEQCLARVKQDDATALSPLPTVLAKREERRFSRWSRRATYGVGGLALAASLLVGLRIHLNQGHVGELVGENGVKSAGEVSFSLVRDDDERDRIQDSAGVYHDGERFKAVVTCTPSGRVSFDLVVFDAQGVSFPLAAAGLFACVNEMPLPGAFRLTGHDDETVCLVWTEDSVPDRKKLSSTTADALGEHSLCKHLTAAR
jgi:hypothetical protein